MTNIINIYNPIGDPPYEEVSPKPLKVEVTVSVTLSKTVEIEVDDYDIDYSDGDYDFSECDLKGAVESQVKLPQDTFKDWNVDDFEVVLE